MEGLAGLVIVVLIGILVIMLIVRLVKGTSRMIDKQHAQVPSGAQTCPHCYAADLDSRATFCKHCGQRIVVPPPPA